MDENKKIKMKLKKHKQKENNVEKEKPINNNDNFKAKKYANKRNWNNYLNIDIIKNKGINIKIKKN